MYRGHYEKEPDMTELFKLRDWLKKNGADFEFYDMPTIYEYDEARPGEPYAIQRIGQHQVIVFDQINGRRMRRWDAVCHLGSYGYWDGLLEVMGCIVPDDHTDTVMGFLTADQVIEMEKERRKRER